MHTFRSFPAVVPVTVLALALATGPGSVFASPAITIGDPDSGAELIGRPAPPLTFDRWLRSRPLSLRALRGKVVLVRWWTEGCRYCSSTLPVLEDLRRRDAGSGLVVIGVFHPKPPRPVSDRHILELADRLGFGGPIAVDGSWKALERWWLDGDPERSWTSVSFLIDRGGVIRWVHGGGEYHPSTDPAHARCDLEYRGLEQILTQVLAEKPRLTSLR
jgi:thiol-disulfide isomerase/thioredoxin